MSLFKRISATVTASVESVVSRVENHDAIIEAALKDCRHAAAKTRVQLSKVKRDSEQMQMRYHKLDADILMWQQRALDCAKNDEVKAIQCVKRMEQSKAEAQSLEATIKKHQGTETKIQNNLNQIESRVSEIKRQRNTMRSRQSAAEATRLIQYLEGDATYGIEDTFDRWETSLIETEIASDTYGDHDSFESEFIAAEESEDLKQKLQALCNQNGEK